MAKKKKKEARFETSIGSTLRNNWIEVSTEAVETGAMGAAGGILIEQAFGVGSTGLNVAIGAASGVAVGLARGTAVCHQREGRLCEMGNEVLEEVQATLDAIRNQQAVADVVKEALKFGQAYLRSQGVPMPEAEKTTKKKPAKKTTKKDEAAEAEAE